MEFSIIKEEIFCILVTHFTLFLMLHKIKKIIHQLDNFKKCNTHSKMLNAKKRFDI